jgi:hypothetical protein
MEIFFIFSWLEKIEDVQFVKTYLVSYLQMEFNERRKKSDKAKDKAGKPSQKHVRQYEALMEARAKEGLTTKIVAKPAKK